jgi:hypothetical protein
MGPALAAVCRWIAVAVQDFGQLMMVPGWPIS